MARIRTIKPEFWSHPILGGEPDEIRLAAIGLLNYADDEGYFVAAAGLVRSAIWPLDDDSSKARRVLARLSAVGWIEVREHPEHGPIGRIVNFRKHQRIDRPTASRLATYFNSTNPRRALDEDSTLYQGIKGSRDQGSGGAGEAPPAPRAPGRDEHDIGQPPDPLPVITGPQPAAVRVSPIDLPILLPGLHLPPADRPEAEVLLRLYGHEAMQTVWPLVLGRARDERWPVAPAKDPKRVWLSELRAGLQVRFALDPEDYERAGMPVPREAARA